MGNAVNKLPIGVENRANKSHKKKKGNRQSKISVKNRKSETKSSPSSDEDPKLARQRRGKKPPSKSYASPEVSPLSKIGESVFRDERKGGKVSVSDSERVKRTKNNAAMQRSAEMERMLKAPVDKYKTKPSAKGKNAKTQCTSRFPPSAAGSDSCNKLFVLSPKLPRKKDRKKKTPQSPESTPSPVAAAGPSAPSTATVDLDLDAVAAASTKKKRITSSGSETTATKKQTGDISRGDARNILVMVDEWKKEEERLQKEYDDAQERIHSSIVEENQAKAQAQTWRAKLERLAISHRERLFRQATLLRSRLRSAEQRLRSTESRAKGLVVTNTKLKGMIDVVKEEARSLRVESEKKRESARRELNEKLLSVEGELKKLKERIVSSGITENGQTKDDDEPMLLNDKSSREAETRAKAGHQKDGGTTHASKPPSSSHQSSAVHEHQNRVHSRTPIRCATQEPLPIPPTVIPSPNFPAYELPSVHSGQYATPYSRYVPISYVSYPNFSNTYTIPQRAHVYMPPSVRRYRPNPDTTDDSYCSHGIPCSAERTQVQCHSHLSTGATRYPGLPVAQPPEVTDTYFRHAPQRYSHVPRNAGNRSDSGAPKWRSQSEGDRLMNIERNRVKTPRSQRAVPRNPKDSDDVYRSRGRRNETKKQSIAGGFCSGSGSRRTYEVSADDNTTPYDTSTTCVSQHGKRVDDQKLVVLEREVYNAYARGRDRKMLQADNGAATDYSGRRFERKPPRDVWLKDKTKEESGEYIGDRESADSDNGSVHQKQYMSTIRRPNPSGRRSGASETSHDPSSPTGAESAPTPYHDRGYSGDFERSTSSIEIAKRRRIIRHHAAASRQQFD